MESKDDGSARGLGKFYVILIVLLLIAIVGFGVIRKFGNVANNDANTESSVDDEYERIQKEIREVRRLNVEGKISDEEAKQRLHELSEKLIKILKESR